MKKKAITWMLLLLLFSCFAVACGTKEPPSEQDDRPTQGAKPTKGQDLEEEEEPPEEVLGDGTVVWTMQDALGKIPEENISALNERLKADGYSCTLSIRYVSQKIDYYDRLSELLRTGETDIATFSFISFADDGTRDIRDTVSMIREGNVEQLDAYLSSKEGQALWNACYEDAWEMRKIDQGTFLIPNQAQRVGVGYLAFRRDYFTEEEAEKVSLDFGELETLLESKELPGEVTAICGWNESISYNAFMAGNIYLYGVFLDLGTGEVKNPYEVQEYKKLMQELHSLYQKGMLKTVGSQAEEKIVTEETFAVWRTMEVNLLLENNRDKLILLPMPYAWQSSGMGVGVSKNAKQKTEALQLLTLLYTKEDYANLLIYGEKGKEYQIIDGFACDESGEPKRNYFYCYMTGLYDNVLPTQSDEFPVNRKQVKDELYYSDARKKSITIGFRVDTSTFDEEMLALNGIVQGSQDIWMKKDLEAAWEAAEKAFFEAGGEKVMEEISRQLEEWMQKN